MSETVHQHALPLFSNGSNRHGDGLAVFCWGRGEDGKKSLKKGIRKG